MSRKGIFWVVDYDYETVLLAKPFEEGTSFGVSKSGDNYNHRLMWEYVKPRGCSQSFDYYPRGRVEINSKGVPIVFMSSYIGEEALEQIKKVFELGDNLKIHYDGSVHYKCHWDWEDK